MLGSLTRKPSRSLDIFTWHPRREVSVKPKARSSISFSSSSGSDILSYSSFDSTMTWHVEQAQEPPHAPITNLAMTDKTRVQADYSPSISRSSDCAISKRLSPSATSNVLSWPSLSINVTLILYSESSDSSPRFSWYCSKIYSLLPWLRWRQMAMHGYG